jgi:hypothetical protein
MPVVSAKDENTGRAGGRRWFWVLLLPAFLFLLLVAPMFRPVVLGVGDHWVAVGTTLGPARPDEEQGFSADAVMLSEVQPWSLGRWSTVGGFQVRQLRIGKWVYSVGWFRGRRLS